MKNNKKNKISENLNILRKKFNFTLEEFAKKINLPFDTARNYEQNNIIPPLKNIIKMSNLLEISTDFFLLWDQTNYIKNLKLIRLAKILDDNASPSERTTIEMNTNSFLKTILEKRINIKQDKLDIDLTSNIHDNIKILREKKEISQKELAEMLKVNQSQIAHYQNKFTPPAENLIKLSEIFNISIHALATGEKLNFQFTDGHFGKTMLLADHFLPLEQHKILITLMEAIIKNP